MTLWLVLFLMTAAAIFAVLWPLSRHGAVRRSGSDMAVYRDQLAEIERDLAAGLIGAAEAEAARVEVSRRLLAAAGTSGVHAQGVDRPRALWHRRVAALAALVLMPAGAAVLYLMLGSPFLAGAPFAGRQDVPFEQRSIESMVAQVESHLEKNPQDGRGWEVLAPVYMRLGRFEDAVKARRNAVRLLGATPAREADLGEALAAAANGIVTAEAKAAFDRALAGDRDNVKAQYFAGLAAEQDGRAADAARIWRTLLQTAPVNAGYRTLIEDSLARVDSGAAAPNPGADDIAAAESLSPEQRAEFVRGMVERLAARLKSDGSDAEAWLRLVRAYLVLGEAEQARSAARDARNAVAGDAEKIKRLDDGLRRLGIEG